jgi:hypothetical protein
VRIIKMIDYQELEDMPEIRARKIHKIECNPENFQLIQHGNKSFEIFPSSQDIQVIDSIKFVCGDDRVIASVSYILSKSQALKSGYSIVSFTIIDNGLPDETLPF